LERQLEEQLLGRPELEAKAPTAMSTPLFLMRLSPGHCWRWLRRQHDGDDRRFPLHDSATRAMHGTRSDRRYRWPLPPPAGEVRTADWIWPRAMTDGDHGRDLVSLDHQRSPAGQLHAAHPPEPCSAIVGGDRVPAWLAVHESQDQMGSSNSLMSKAMTSGTGTPSSLVCWAECRPPAGSGAVWVVEVAPKCVNDASEP
jgi:hypothetical protein